MTVVDKHVPVDPTPRTLTAPGAVVVGGWALALLVSLASPATLSAEATYGGWGPGVTAALRMGASLGAASPFGWLRTTLDGLIDPFDHTTRWFRRSVEVDDPGGAPLDSPEVAPEDTDTRPPGERWTAIRPRPLSRVLIVGASSIQYAVGTELERVMSDTLDVEVTRKGKVSTGLTRPDVFDWPAEVQRLVADVRPQLVVGQFGGNDGQNIVAEDGTIHEVYTDGWAEEYSRRIRALTGIVQAGGARLLLMGMPVMRSDRFSKKVRWLNEITETAVTGAGGDYLDTWNMAADPQGAYLAEVVLDGRSGRMRMDDGIHFTRQGGQHVARQIQSALLRRYPFRFKAPDDPVETDADVPPRPASLVRLTVPTGAGRGPSDLFAFVPDDVPPQGLPWIVLLHGAWDSPAGFIDHLAVELATLASERKVIVAMPDGGEHGWWMDAPAQPEHRLGTWLRDVALPFGRRTLPVDPDAPQGLAGLSMGGHGALKLVLDDPDAWAAVATISAVLDLRHTADKALDPLMGSRDDAAPWASLSALSRLQRNPAALGATALWLGVGTDDRLHADHVALHALLDEAHVPHAWREVDGGHTWAVWTEAVPAMLRWEAGVLSPPAAAAPPVDAAP